MVLLTSSSCPLFQTWNPDGGPGKGASRASPAEIVLLTIVRDPSFEI
jgi:hypothetical protein